MTAGPAVLSARYHAAVAASRQWLAGLPRPAFAVFAAALSLGVSLFFFAPRLCILAVEMPGSYEWDRARTFLGQCADPFADAAEPAMQWRLLPPLVAHTLHLPGRWPLAIPWVGLGCLLAYLALSAERFLAADRLGALLLTVLFGTSGAVVCITMSHGINDAWFMLGLLVVAVSRQRWAPAAACLLAPWVDERFLLGLPLAVFCRWILFADVPAGVRRKEWVAIGGAAAVYGLVRLAFTGTAGDRGSLAFLGWALEIVPVYMPFAHLGWWMGFRAGWIPVLYCFRHAYTTGGRELFHWGILATLAGWGAVTLLAADLTRSTNLLLPLLFAGTVGACRKFGPVRVTHGLLALVVFNLATPWVMVTYNKTLLIHPLLFELVRLYKNPY